MAFAILGNPKPAFFDSSGAPLVSGTLSVLEPADDTNKASYPTYDDAEALTNANSNPITLDSRGECDLWGLDGEDYKLVLKDSSGNTVYTIDDIFLPTFTAAITARTIRPITASLVTAGKVPTGTRSDLAFSRNATIVEDFTLLASASATTLNNNNVIAALIGELQRRSLID